MFLLICKLYISILNVFGHIFYRSRLHLYWQLWQFELKKLAYMLIWAAGGMIPYLSSVRGWSTGLGNIYKKKTKKFFDCFPNTKFWEVIWKYVINKKNFGVLLGGKNATKPALLRKETNYIHFPEMRLSQDISVKTSLFCRKLFHRGETKHETKNASAISAFS